MNFQHAIHIRTFALRLIATTLLSVCASHAWASEPKERVICTSEPRSSWMSQAQAQERFQTDKYLLVRFKIASENCHEFYAVEHDGTTVEAYVHPITGEVVRLTRIQPPQGSASTSTSR